VSDVTHEGEKERARFGGVFGAVVAYHCYEAARLGLAPPDGEQMRGIVEDAETVAIMAQEAWEEMQAERRTPPPGPDGGREGR